MPSSAHRHDASPESAPPPRLSVREIVKRDFIRSFLRCGKYLEEAAYSAGGGQVNGHHIT